MGGGGREGGRVAMWDVAELPTTFTFLSYVLAASNHLNGKAREGAAAVISLKTGCVGIVYYY